MRTFPTSASAIAWCEERLQRIGHDTALEASVRGILSDVRARGDAALLDYTERFDGARLDGVLVPEAELNSARARMPTALAEAIEVAAARIAAYYGRQTEGGFLHSSGGAVLGQLVLPIGSVGCYVPGGTAPLFSTVLMTAVPARVAGVERIVVATPPLRDGSVPAAVLYAARVAGVSEVLRVGGPHGVGALAYGTGSVERVEKIVGPGNRYVIEAKRQLFGSVGIEALPGPTETLVVADDGADPRHVVADLLAQAEHAAAQPVLVTTSHDLLEEVLDSLPSAAAALPEPAAALESLAERGVAVLAEDLESALRVANAFAPEHLCLLVQDPWAAVPLVRNAGGLFLGPHSSEALGDYVVGPSHVMPTGGTARFSSFLNLRDFQKVIPITALTQDAASKLAPLGATMARAEGLEAHARAVEERLEVR